MRYDFKVICGLGELTLWKALKSCQGLASVPLLNTDVNVVRLGSDVLSGCKRVTLVREGVCKRGIGVSTKRCGDR